MKQLKCDPSHNWLPVRIVGNTNAFGGGGLKAFSDHLTDDDIYYGALRCSVDEQVKFFHVYFVGQSVIAMKKGRALPLKQAIFNLVEAYGELTFSSCLAEYSDNLMIQAIQSLTKSTNIAI